MLMTTLAKRNVKGSTLGMIKRVSSSVDMGGPHGKKNCSSGRLTLLEKHLKNCCIAPSDQLHPWKLKNDTKLSEAH